MNRTIIIITILLIALLLAVGCASIAWAGTGAVHADSFPRPLESYEDSGGLWEVLRGRVSAEPFNLVATLIFLLAIVHTFLTSRFLAISHRWAHRHQERIARGEVSRDSVHQGSELMHFLGEVEAVFGIWAVALMIAIVAFYDWSTAVHYVGGTVNFTEPAFVVVIMTLAATRPILRLVEGIIRRVAGLLGGSLSALWFWPALSTRSSRVPGSSMQRSGCCS
jgi:hypothetical protein